MLPLILIGLFAACQAAPECKNCMILGKDAKAMFAAHSEACLPQSRADPRLVERLVRGELRGEPLGEPALRRHVYCVLLRCKLISKDGTLRKAAALPKMPARADGKNATKVLENCAEQSGDSPEERAWNLFRCGCDKKAVLSHRAHAADAADAADAA